MKEKIDMEFKEPTPQVKVGPLVLEDDDIISAAVVSDASLNAQLRQDETNSLEKISVETPTFVQKDYTKTTNVMDPTQPQQNATQNNIYAQQNNSYAQQNNQYTEQNTGYAQQNNSYQNTGYAQNTGYTQNAGYAQSTGYAQTSYANQGAGYNNYQNTNQTSYFGSGRYENSGYKVNISGIISCVLVDLFVLSWALPTLLSCVAGYVALVLRLIISGIESIFGFTSFMSGWHSIFPSFGNIFVGTALLALAGLGVLLGIKIVKAVIKLIKTIINWHGKKIIGRPIINTEKKQRTKTNDDTFVPNHDLF